MHAKYVAIQLVHSDDVASKLSFVALAPRKLAALYSRCQPRTGAVPANHSLRFPQLLALAARLKMHQCPLVSCAVYGQSCNRDTRYSGTIRPHRVPIYKILARRRL